MGWVWINLLMLSRVKKKWKGVQFSRVLQADVDRNPAISILVAKSVGWSVGRLVGWLVGWFCLSKDRVRVKKHPNDFSRE